MRPPACVSCKWGSGTTCEKPQNTQAQTEMKSKMEAMMAERAKQDAKWFAPPQEQEEPSPNQIKDSNRK